MAELLQKLGVDWRLFIAQLVNFLILFFLLRKFLYRPVLGMLERRQERIAEGLRDAELSKKRLSEIDLERKQILQQAAMERQRVLEGAALEAEDLHRQRLQTAASEAQAIIDRSRVEADRVRAELLAEVRREVGNLVLAISRKVTSERLSKQAHDQLVDDAIKELGQAQL